MRMNKGVAAISYWYCILLEVTEGLLESGLFSTY